jgi:N-acetylglucosaminyldiphosphoundecaprenol N-acetyl-beta-D-mannosaminyltransferase
MSRKQAHILKVKVDSTTKERVLRLVRASLEKGRKGRKFYIVTPNPEHVLIAQEDKEFRKIINEADLSVPDGVGLAAAKTFLSLPNPDEFVERAITLFVQGMGVGMWVLIDRKRITKEINIVKGRELFIDLIKLANKKYWKVFLLGGEREEAKDAGTSLERNYKKVKISFDSGPLLDTNGMPINKKEKKKEEMLIKKINKQKPHLLFVGMSAPKQEKWLYRNLKKIDVGGAMVVGGTFRYVSGQVKLPPYMISDIGLEWLWRLSSGSQNFDRIIQAVIVFPWTVFKYKFNLKG